MQLVYGHSGNLGNECADHATALGTSGFTSSHNVTTRCIHHNFDSSVMAVTRDLGTITAHSNKCDDVPPVQSSAMVFFHWVHRVFAHFT